MAIVSSFTYEIRIVSFAQFTVDFTDTSTGSPTNWLWDFGDGHCSTEQHPIHTYRGKWEKSENDFTPNAVKGDDGEILTYIVRLTAWKNETVLAPGLPQLDTTTLFYQDMDGFSSQSNAQNALWATLPYTSWTSSVRDGFTALKYHLNKLVTTWAYEASYSTTTFDFGSYPLATHVAWMVLRINDTRFGLESYTDLESYSIKIGNWNASLNDWGDELVHGIRIGILLNKVDYPIFSMEDYLGDATTSTIRTVDAFDFERPLHSGGISFKGYNIYKENPNFQLIRVPSTDDIGRSSQTISANPSILTRPPVLYSGIKEAFFEDGWENEKYIYIEQSSPYPAVIEFIDIYAETSNE